MKTKLTLALLTVFSLALMQSCREQDDKKAYQSELSRLNRLLNGKDDKTLYPGGQIVPRNLAMDCIRNYEKLYKPALNTDALQYAFAKDVSFGVNGLLKWMINMKDSTNVDNIRVFYGVYTADMLAQYPNRDITPGRLTVFIWPYNGSKKAVYNNYGVGEGESDTTSAFNLGNVLP
ncbi:MAG: hypothetical protein EOO43_23190 [Flavobacterium sp.]|nr:MAG: hypothetical protein EOO43_23190 [Flavobacterium sp.]